MSPTETLPVDLDPVGHHRLAGTVLATHLVDAARALFANEVVPRLAGLAPSDSP